ncbi:hypothetical protein PRNP1_004705 [Phytophthora ramorum]
MDEYSSAVAPRRSWSKSLQQKQRGGLSQRKEHTLTLPVLARRPSGLQVGAGSRTSSLHAFLASQLENNERESYSRSQLRAMASSKLQASSNNNVASSNPRVHERLTPLDPNSLEKARPQQRRPLPGHLQAAINEVLATRNPEEALSDREDSCTDSSTNYESIVSEAVASPIEPSDASSIAARDCVQAESTCASTFSDEIACPEHSSTSPEVPRDELVDTKNVFAPSAQLPSNTDEYLGGHKSTSSDDVDSQQQSDQPSQNLDDLTVRVSFEENQAILGDCTPVDSPILDNQADLLPCKEQQSPEINTPDCAFKGEPQDDNHSPHEVDTPAELSTSADHLPILDNSVEDTSELAALAATERQTLAGKRIARNLQPKVQARHGIKTHAAIRIQCFIRSLLAKKYLVCMRLTALHSLRAQLLASWHQVDLKAQSSLADNQPEEILYDPEIDDEEDDFDVEMHGCQPHNHSVSDNYLHLLPTRNGQIPPGVPLLQSSAGAPLLSLWKWSWPGERWLSNGQ